MWENLIVKSMRFSTGFVQNSDDDLDCNDLDEHGWCEADHPGMLLVLEYNNDRWINLGISVTKSLLLRFFKHFRLSNTV